MKINKHAALAAAAMFCPGLAFCQTNLNFNSISATVEGAIRLSWTSTANEVYEIDCADSLVDTNTGSIAWNLLYDDYPSQGTNTFWLDTGSYFTEPPNPHPSKAPMRFYRIVLSGTNTAPAPAVSITSPTNGFSATGNLTVTVSASSDQPFVSTKLYVDGEEMQEPTSTTNYVGNGTNYVSDTYVLNTCEWPNGSHTLFATSSSQSGPSGMHDVPTVLIGRAVSAFVPGTYNNLITRISFSEPFFAPEDGETQRVSSAFAANVDWTLQIQDSATNPVRTATGSGTSMLFNWDGTDAAGANLPVGNYTYMFTAQTNGQAFESQTSGGGGSGGPPSPTFASATSGSETGYIELLAMPADGSGAVVPWLLYPPGVDTQGLIIFEGSMDDFRPQATSLSVAMPTGSPNSGSGLTSGYSGPSSQSSRAPVRPPISPVRGRAGVFGIAYQTYRGVANGYTVANPDNGLHVGIRIGMEGYSGSHSINYPVLWQHITEARNFIKEMKKGNWSMGFDRFDDRLSINDLRASGANIFNQVKLGLLMLHGAYGTDPDYTANACQQMYFPVTSGASAQYIRMSEMNFGSSDTNGLKWMAIPACNSLYQPNWSNMQNYGVQPFNSNLHLLLGTDSIVWTHPHALSLWAKYMTVGKTNGSPMTIESAWYEGPHDAYLQSGFNYTNAMSFAAAGDANCRDDLLLTNNAPTGTPYYNSQQVWP